MKKNFKSLFVVFLLALVCMTSCGKEDKNIENTATNEQNTEGKKTIYASFFQ